MANLLIPEPPLQVLPTLAKLIGLNEAMFLQQLHYWLLRATREKDGHKWVFKTYAEWQKQDYPFWSERTIRRIVENLEARGLVVTTDAYNRLPGDKTKWYRIDYEAVDALTTGQIGQSHRPDCPEGTGQIVQGQWPLWPEGTGQIDQSSTGQNGQCVNQRIETTTETTGPETTTRDAASGDGGDDDLVGGVFTMFEDEGFGRLTSQVAADELGDLVDTFGAAVVIEAMRIAVLQNVRKLSYVRGVLIKQQQEAAAGADDGTDGWRRFISGRYADEIEW